VDRAARGNRLSGEPAGCQAPGRASRSAARIAHPTASRTPLLTNSVTVTVAVTDTVIATKRSRAGNPVPSSR
jgi:hypothetical protein